MTKHPSSHVRTAQPMWVNT